MKKLSVLWILLIFAVPGLAKEKGLVGYWAFEEGEGEIVEDKSGQGHDGKIFGAEWVKGIKGKALKFNGVDNYVVVQNHSDFEITDAITVEAWVKIEADIKKERCYEILNHSPDRGPGFRLYCSQKVYFRSGEGYGADGKGLPCWQVTSQRPISLDEWHYIVATFDGKFYKLYIDGELKNTLNDTRPITIAPSSTPLTIGDFYRRNVFPFKGIIDEVKIYNRAKTHEEILKAMQF